MVDFVLNSRSEIGTWRFLKIIYLRGASPPGPRCFWIESLLPTGYRVSLISVSESVSQNSLKSPIHYECWIQNLPYLYNYKSKVKFRSKSVSEHCASFEKNFFSQTILRILNVHISKTIKLIFHSFQNIAKLFGPKKFCSFWRRGVCMSLTRTGPSQLP